MHRRPLTRPARAAALAAVPGLAVLAVAACSGTGSGSVSPAAQATSAGCTAALKTLPEQVLGLSRSPLDVAGAAAWGTPPVVLRCGVPAPGPTTLRCLSVNDVDWIVDDRADPIVLTTYGRTPGLELRVPRSYGPENAAQALPPLAGAARALPTDGHPCIG